MTHTDPEGAEPSDPTQCSGEEGFCPEHGFHRHSLKQPGQPETATDQTAELDRLRTENERMRHELEVMYGGAFDSVKSATDQSALRNAVSEALHAVLNRRLGEGAWTSLLAESADAMLAALPASVDRADEEHRLALSEALGLGTGAPWDAIHERATELGLAAEHRATARAEAFREAAVATRRGAFADTFDRMADEELRRVAAEPADVGVGATAGPADEAQAFAVQVWPLARVLTEVRCGSQDWTWEEEWADLDRRHAETGYLSKLEQDIAANGITMPVLVGTDGRLWDGHHRLRIAARLGIGFVPVEVPVASEVPTAAPSAGGVRQPSQADGDRVVAYRSHSRRLLRCLTHAPDQVGLDSGAFQPVTADDLPDGGICTHPDCLVDVLIPQQKEARP